MTDVNTDKILEGIKEHFATPKVLQLIEDLKAGGLLRKISVGIALVVEGIAIVEHISTDLADMGVKGSEKKKALVKFLDDAVDLPFYAEPFDGPIISLAIDGIVGYYNAKLGHGWIAIVKQFLL